jgi:predicted membrane channel-forming protein YqfA (hemolysin III family)
MNAVSDPSEFIRTIIITSAILFVISGLGLFGVLSIKKTRLTEKARKIIVFLLAVTLGGGILTILVSLLSFQIPSQFNTVPDIQLWFTEIAFMIQVVFLIVASVYYLISTCPFRKHKASDTNNFPECDSV